MNKQRKMIALTPELYEQLKQARIAYAAKHKQDITLQDYAAKAIIAGIKNLK